MSNSLTGLSGSSWPPWGSFRISLEIEVFSPVGAD